jgi:hypothetical protein
MAPPSDGALADRFDPRRLIKIGAGLFRGIL